MGSACWESGDARRVLQDSKVAITPSTPDADAVAGFWLGRFEAQGVIAINKRGVRMFVGSKGYFE